MLGISARITGITSNGLSVFTVNPQNSLIPAEIRDSITQIGADTASIQAVVSRNLNFTFLTNNKKYDLKLYPSKIKIVYLGPNTLASAKAKKNSLVYGVIYSKSLTIKLEQNRNEKVNYKWLLDEAKSQLKTKFPQLGVALSLINVDTLSTTTTTHVIASWTSKNQNLVYGIKTAIISPIENTIGGMKRFSGGETYALTIGSRCSDPVSAEYNRREQDTDYRLCYKMIAGKPELVVTAEPQPSNVLPFIIPRNIGLNGPVDAWTGNYLVALESRNQGAATQMIYLQVDAALANATDKSTVKVIGYEGENPITGIYYPAYKLKAR